MEVGWAGVWARRDLESAGIYMEQGASIKSVSVGNLAGRDLTIGADAGVDERQRLRTKAVADGVWPPPGGPDQLLAQQADVFLPAEFSPLH